MQRGFKPSLDLKLKHVRGKEEDTSQVLRWQVQSPGSISSTTKSDGDGDEDGDGDGDVVVTAVMTTLVVMFKEMAGGATLN